jgi:hypothetical protein
MSSPRTVAANIAPRAKPAPRPAPKGAKKRAIAPTVAPANRPADPGADVRRLAAVIESGLAHGRSDLLVPVALQYLMAALCKSYSAPVEVGEQLIPSRTRESVNGTEILMTTSGLLKAADLPAFKLGMCQHWTGR